MSRDSYDRDDEAAGTPDRRKPLTQGEMFALFRDEPAVRPYLFGALGALAMIFLVMFLSGSDTGAVIVVLFALAGLAFRWVAAPPLFLCFLVYFQLFPFGFPDVDDLYRDPFQVRDTHFRMTDVILVLAVLLYLRCQYRIFGLVQQAIPFENVFLRRGEYPVRRPPGHIDPVEIGWLLATTLVLVVVGQVVWWFVNALDFTPADPEFPLRWADTDSVARFQRRRRDPGEFSAGESRFFIVLGALFFGYLLVRLVFGYWRLRTMNAAEGAMILTDTSWSESHRERVRVEQWRLWGRQRAAELRRAALRAERARREKEQNDRREKEQADRDRARTGARMWER